MIPRYNDHAANERTYLAWLRTSLSLVAFGFVLERFDLFLRTLDASFAQTKQLHVGHLGREAGIVLIGCGIVTMLLSSWRFVTTSRNISCDEPRSYSPRIVLIMGGMFLLLSLMILLYVSRFLNWN
jgi:putative membrane protein